MRAIMYNFILQLIYSCDFHEGTTFHHIVDACVEFCFLKKEFLNLTINTMQLLYFITTVTSQVHSARHHQRAG